MTSSSLETERGMEWRAAGKILLTLAMVAGVTGFFIHNAFTALEFSNAGKARVTQVSHVTTEELAAK